MESADTAIEIYTDGSVITRRDIRYGGCGVHFPNHEFVDISVPFTCEPVTNQRAELYAILLALEITNAHASHIIIHSDSSYSIRCVTTWIRKWKRNGWMTTNNTPVKNLDIILAIDAMLQNTRVSFVQVRAHTKGTDAHSVRNDVADKLACAASARHASESESTATSVSPALSDLSSTDVCA